MRNRLSPSPKSAEQALVRLRPMTAADLPAVVRLDRQTYPTPWPASFFRQLLRRRASCWVYELRGRVVGYGVMQCAREWAHIMNLCIAPQLRRLGLGRRMLLRMLEVAKGGGAKRVWLEVHPSNREAIVLYRSLGFSIQYRRKRYYRSSPQRQRDALVMLYTLHD